MAFSDWRRDSPHWGGFIDPLRSFLAKFVGLLQTRLELICTELEEEKERLKESVLLAAAALFFLSLGILLLTLWVVVLFWESYRLYVLGGFALLYLALGLILGLLAKLKARRRPRLFSATLSELAKDRDQLRS